MAAQMYAAGSALMEDHSQPQHPDRQSQTAGASWCSPSYPSHRLGCCSITAYSNMLSAWALP